MQSLWAMSLPAWHFVLRGAVVYSFILLLLRLSGKREVGQMGRGEFVAILLISNAVQNSMNGGDNSITGGLILASTIIVLSTLVAWATFRSRRIAALIQGRPTLVVHHGAPVEAALRQELLSMHELHTMLRRQGIHTFQEIHEAVLESDGSLSVVRTADLPGHRNP